jgi:hypothetical protein
MAEELNRSSALSPDQMALVNGMISAAVKEAVGGVFGQLGPILKDLALTPEKIQAMEDARRAPTKEQEDFKKRMEREKREFSEQDAETRAKIRAMQDSCPHRDENDKEAICLVHNYPDRQVRGICPICWSLIEPRHWAIEAPDPKTGKTKPILIPAHRDYARVLLKQSRHD